MTFKVSSYILKILLIFTLVLQSDFIKFRQTTIRYKSTPVVLLHGLGGTYNDLIPIKSLIELHVVPKPYVKNLRIGNSKAGDSLNGIFMGIEKQVDIICNMIKDDDNLKDGYNAIGFSQGGVILRGVVQTCIDGPPVIHLITLGSPHQGVYGMPSMTGYTKWQIRAWNFVQKIVHSEWVQERIVQAGYWHDIDSKIYAKKNSFLAVINNEKEFHYEYWRKMVQLKKLVLVRYMLDDTIIPRTSQVFGFYKECSNTVELGMEETALYREDKIGLKHLHDSGKLDILEVNGGHLHHTSKWFLEHIILEYLD